jgi:hypothetical protein
VNRNLLQKPKNVTRAHFQVNIIIHFNGHNVLQNVNWESLAAKAEALDRQVEKGLR